MRVSSTMAGILGAASSVSAWTSAGRDDSAQGSKLQDTLQALSSFASSSNRQADEAKVGLLKQRLEALKMMMRFASPAALKRFAQELKQIAGELASIGEQAGGSGGAASSQPVAASVNALLGGGEAQGAAGSGASAQVDAAKQEAQAASSTADAAQPAATAAAKGEQPAGATPAPTTAGGERKPGTADGNASLRAILAEARRKLAEALMALRARSRELDSEGRRDLQAAEDSLGKLDKALGGAGGSAPAVADVAPDAGGFANWVGTNVDVKV